MITSKWYGFVAGDAPGRQNAGGSVHSSDSSFLIRLIDHALLPSSIRRLRVGCEPVTNFVLRCNVW
jgi:hypothetical protein